jgi:hypothetical protein
MQATYDLRKSSIQPFAITFAVVASLILGGAGGFALKSVTQATVSREAAPVVATSQASTVSADPSRSQRMLRLEIQDQTAQAKAGAASVPNSGGRSYTPGKLGPQ